MDTLTWPLQFVPYLFRVRNACIVIKKQCLQYCTYHYDCLFAGWCAAPFAIGPRPWLESAGWFLLLNVFIEIKFDIYSPNHLCCKFAFDLPSCNLILQAKSLTQKGVMLLGLPRFTMQCTESAVDILFCLFISVKAWINACNKCNS